MYHTLLHVSLGGFLQDPSPGVFKLSAVLVLEMMPVVEDACRLINDQTAFIISSAQRQKNIPLTQISLIDRIRIQKQKSYQYM